MKEKDKLQLQLVERWGPAIRFIPIDLEILDDSRISKCNHLCLSWKLEEIIEGKYCDRQMEREYSRMVILNPIFPNAPVFIQTLL